MDRFLDGRDSAEPDFLRLEYATSLKQGKNIVPVYKEDFEFVSKDRLPEDVRGVVDMNAIKWVSEYRDASFAKLVDSLRAE